MNKLAPIFFFILLFLFGCTEMSREEANLCYSLTSKSFTYIPTCESESSCYIKVDALFKTNFSIKSENDLYHLKNNVGRSWFYYNKAIVELKKISEQCSDKNPNNLPGYINQTRFYLNNAFEELDNSIKKSFEIILDEFNFLENQEISLIKEEKIYDNYIEFKQILTELNNDSFKSNSYVSFYNNKIENFKAKNSQTFGNLIEKDSFQIKFLNFSVDSLFDELKIADTSNKFYFLSGPIRNMFNYFETLIYTTQSLSYLKNLPTSELMLLYSDLIGDKHSSIQQFYELMNRYSINLNEVNNTKNQLWKNVEEEYLNSNNLKKTSKTSETIEYIRTNLISDKIESYFDLENEFINAEKSLINLRKAKFENNLTIGSEISQLKEINNTFKILNKKFKERHFQNNTIINEACDKKANEILKLTNDLVEIQKIYDDLIFYANQTLNESEIKAEFCKKAIEKEKDFILGKSDLELLKAKQIDLTKECFSYLDNIFKQIKLSELETLYQELKKEEVTNQNLFYFKDACEKIKKQVDNEIYSNKNIIELEKNYIELMNLKNELILIEEIGGKSQKTKINEAEKEINSLNVYRKNNSFEYDKIIGIYEKLNQTLINFNEKLKAYLIEEKIEIIIKNISYKNIHSDLIFAKEDFESKLLIEINNPFEKIEKEVSFKIPFLIDISSPLIKNFLKGEKESIVILKEVPLGKTTFNSTYKNRIDFEINEKILLANNKESIIQNKINILNDEDFFKVAFTLPIQNYNKIVVLKDEKEIPFIVENNKITFILENVNKKSEIILQLYVSNLIILSENLKSVENISEEVQQVEYEIVAKNTISKKLNASLLLDFKNDFLIKKINIYDNQFVNKQITFINDQILIKNIDFFEKEEKKFILIAQINNSKEYYTNQLTSLLLELKDNSPNLTKKIETHLTLQFNENWIKIAIELIKEANLEIEKINKTVAQEEQLLIIKEEILNKIEEYELSLNELEQMGFLSEYETIESIIQDVKENLDNDDLLLENLTKLNDLNFSINDIIIEELYEIKNFLETIDSEGELKLQKDSILDLINNFNFESDLIYLKENYFEIKKQYNLFLEEIEKKNELDSKKIIELKEKITESKNLIKILKNELSFSSEKLIEIRFIPPITISRLDKLELTLNSFNENELIENEFEILNIYNELLASYSDIKKQAIDLFNSRVEENISISVLENAKNEIDNNNYISSMFVLNKKETDNNTIIGLIPIILIIIIAIVFAIYTKKNNKKLKEKETEINNSWED